MKCSVRLGLALAAICPVFLLGLFLAGCSPTEPDRKKDSGPTSELLERTSPENVLHNLQVIYADKEQLVSTPEDVEYWSARYRELFHGDSAAFKFYFVPYDLPPGLPGVWWGVEEEAASFEGLLNAVVLDYVEDVELTWTVAPSEPDSTPRSDSDELLHPDWRHIFVTSYVLEVRMGVDAYRATGAADFYFGPDPSAPQLWVLTEWWDRAPSFVRRVNAGSARGEMTTWSKLKALFH